MCLVKGAGLEPASPHNHNSIVWYVCLTIPFLVPVFPGCQFKYQKNEAIPSRAWTHPGLNRGPSVYETATLTN